MYNPLLKTFVTVAECRSFTQAAEILFISPTAVMKQMNALEEHINLKLIERSHSGIKLTRAGEAIYKDAVFLIDYSQKAIREALVLSQEVDLNFNVGTSILNPAKPFMDLWYKINQSFPSHKLHLVPFEDDHEGILSKIKNLGNQFDFLIGVCDSKAWLSFCNFYPLGRYRKMIAVPQDHRLAQKHIIEISDLHGETLMMVKKGDSGINDFIRNDLETNHPQIKIEDTPYFYDMSVFNRCVKTGNALLSIECWKDVHPSLVNVEVNWNYTIPYGLIYSLHPSQDVLKLVEFAKEISENSQ